MCGRERSLLCYWELPPRLSVMTWKLRERERERDWESVCILGDRRSFFFFREREREREREVWLWLDISGAWGWGWGWAGRRYSLNLQIPSGKSHLLFPLFFSLLPRSLFLLISTCRFHCHSLFLIFSTLFKNLNQKKTFICFQCNFSIQSILLLPKLCYFKIFEKYSN